MQPEKRAENRVPISPTMIRWARERADRTLDELSQRAQFKKLPEWESGATSPTRKQLASFARAVHVPEGYLFRSEPPDEPVPIPDFRTMRSRALTRPSPDLLETVYLCQSRQAWYRDYVLADGQQELALVGGDSLRTPPTIAAEKLRKVLGFTASVQDSCKTWEDALRRLATAAESAGILTMSSGIVGTNTRRRLNPEEFRGFALADPFAPLVFVNGADSKAAQMFTLAHELAHISLGETALSDLGARPPREGREEEAWCNAVAAEFLVPMASLRASLRQDEDWPDALRRLASRFKVSRLVILRRLLDAQWLSRQSFDSAWAIETASLEARKPQKAGGNYYATTVARVGFRFAQAVVVDTLEGRTLYLDALQLLCLGEVDAFKKLARELEVIE